MNLKNIWMIALLSWTLSSAANNLEWNKNQTAYSTIPELAKEVLSPKELENLKISIIKENDNLNFKKWENFQILSNDGKNLTIKIWERRVILPYDRSENPEAKKVRKILTNKNWIDYYIVQNWDTLYSISKDFSKKILNENSFWKNEAQKTVENLPRFILKNKEKFQDIKVWDKISFFLWDLNNFTLTINEKEYILNITDERLIEIK